MFKVAINISSSMVIKVLLNKVYVWTFGTSSNAPENLELGWNDHSKIKSPSRDAEIKKYIYFHKILVSYTLKRVLITKLFKTISSSYFELLDCFFLTVWRNDVNCRQGIGVDPPLQLPRLCIKHPERSVLNYSISSVYIENITNC